MTASREGDLLEARAAPTAPAPATAPLAAAAPPAATAPKGPAMRAQAAAIDAEAARRFGPLLDEVTAGSRARDRDGEPLSAAWLRDAAEVGLAGFAAPPALGGEGRSLPQWALLLEWVGYRCDDLAVPTLLGYRHAAGALLRQLALGELPGARQGALALYGRYGEAVVRGRRTVSVAYTEGADPFSFRTAAQPCAGGVRVRGAKTWIAGGMIADAVITFAAGPSGDLMALLIERGDHGVSFAPRDLMGMRSLGVARMQLDDVFVPDERVLIESDALTVAQRFFNERRLTLPCGLLGRARRLFEHAVSELSQRLRYRLPVTEMQAVQARLGQCFVALDTARTVLYDTLERAEGCDPVWDVAISTSKYYAVQQADAVVRGLAAVLGGAAYDREQPYERALRDLHACLHLAGTQATLEVDLGVKAIAEVELELARQRARAR
jgi:alkylation response protein AidB-like acyl-CoA dehydrogenase